MVVTDDADLAERARSLRNLCFRREQRFLHNELGYNFRMTNVQAASAWRRSSGSRIIWRASAEWRRFITSGLRKVDGLHLPVERQASRTSIGCTASLLDDAVPFDAAEFAARLKEHGVDTRPFFLGMHEQPVLRERGLFAGEKYPVTERLARRGLYLPSGLGLGETEIDRVCAAVQKWLV